MALELWTAIGNITYMSSLYLPYTRTTMPIYMNTDRTGQVKPPTQRWAAATILGSHTPAVGIGTLPHVLSSNTYTRIRIQRQLALPRL